jgi:hypothetical protein
LWGMQSTAANKLQKKRKSKTWTAQNVMQN